MEHRRKCGTLTEKRYIVRTTLIPRNSGTLFSSIHYITSIVIVYESSTVQNNILIKIDGVAYSYIVEITNITIGTNITPETD